MHSAGGYGSLVAVPDAQVYPVPPGLTPIEAAAFPLDYLTAWRMLVTKADLHAGESVLVWGASGALGTAAIRVAKSLGAVVIAAAGSPAFADRLLQIGADHAVLYKSERVADRVKEMTGGAGADCVFESIGAATFEISMNAVRPFGRIVICGTRSGNCATTNLEDLYYNQIRVLGSRMGSKSEFEEVLRRVSQPELRPVIADELSIDDVRAAHALMEQRRHVGKIVLRHE